MGAGVEAGKSGICHFVGSIASCGIPGKGKKHHR
jgi:hypothetical protein